MASQEWITGSILGEFKEESLISVDIEYRPSSESNRRTLDPVILSSDLPSTLHVSGPANNTMTISGVLPSVNKDTDYYITMRLVETETGNTSHITNTDDRYFVIKSLNKPVAWNDKPAVIETTNNILLEVNLNDYLDYGNGNESFRKVSGELPSGMNFNDNGYLMGYIEEDIEEITDYVFTVRVYQNGQPIENLEDKEFIITVDPETIEQKPVWMTEPNLGNVNINESVGPSEENVKYIYAMNMGITEGIIRYRLATSDDPNNTSAITGLPPGLTLREDGQIIGICSTTQIKDWYFGAYAYKIVEDDDNITYSDYKMFYISTNKGSSEHEIQWTDPTKPYSVGAYTIGEEISGKLPEAVSADGSSIKYTLSGTNYPKGMELSSDGLLYGQLELQPTGTYVFDVMASTDYTYITRTFKVEVKQGLSENALKLYLRINLEYRDEYNEIKNQLNPNTQYSKNIDTYNVSTFPKIDVATLKCYDREVLASMMNFGNPEIVRFGLTEGMAYSHIDGDGNVTANYEVFYKSVDENTYQWTPIKNGDYDFQAKLDQLQTTGDIESDAKLDFNNEDYKTSVRVWKLLGEVDTYSKLIACDISELKFGYFARVLKDETHNDKNVYYMYNGDDDPSRAWDYVGEELPQYPEDPCVNPIIKTSPEDSYNVFNFKNVRNALSQRVYVYLKEGTFYYDEGNQQIVTPTGDIDAIKYLYRASEDIYREDEKLPFIKKGQYYITDEDGSNKTLVKYETHIVYNADDNHVYTNILFKPNFNSPNFMIYEDGGEIYHVNQITNPWCFDFQQNTNITINTVPQGAEMVIPNIKTSDVTIQLLDGNNSTTRGYVTFLDTSVEPLPMWKRKQAEVWKPNTEYKAGDIIIYDSLYYRVKQQFKTGNEFIYDTNLLELINGEVINTELPKNYFPTLDLGYFESGTNRRYLKDLNEAELKGEFWYRRDFLFWELIGEPVYNHDIDTFGIPFYSTQNRLENINKSRKKERTFEIICDTPDVEVSITGTQPDGTPIPQVEHTGHRWRVTFNSGSNITWNVSAGNDYYPEGGSYVVVSDEKHVISLKKKCTITVIPQDIKGHVLENATVVLTATGYTQEGNSIVVREGTKVDYTVNNEGYLGTDGSVTAKNFTHEIKVSLKQYKQLRVQVSYNTLSESDTTLPDIELSGEDSTDLSEITVISHTGRAWKVERSIKVPEGNYVTYYIEKTGLKIKRGNIRVNEDSVLPISLNDNAYTFTVIPTPKDSTVILTAERPLFPQEGNSIVVEGRPQSTMTSWINYIVKKDGYETVENTVEYISSDVVYEVIIKQFFRLVITSTPNDANIKIKTISGQNDWEPNKKYDAHALVKYNNTYYNANSAHTSGTSFNPALWTEVTSSVWVTNGTNVEYEVKRVGYEDVSGNITVRKNESVPVNMVSFGGFCPETTDTDLYCLENNELVSFQNEHGTDSKI